MVVCYVGAQNYFTIKHEVMYSQQFKPVREK